MSNSEDDLRLAVLSAIIAQHGPIPCIHVDRVRHFDRDKKGVVSSTIHFRCAASEIICTVSTLSSKNPGLSLELCTSVTLPHDILYESDDEAWVERDRLCALLKCLPWDRTPVGRLFNASDVKATLRHVVTDADGMDILTNSTDEISAKRWQ